MKQKHVVLLFIMILSTGSLFSQIVNQGNLKILASTDVYFGNSYTNSGTHANNGNLYLTGHFTNNGTSVLPVSGKTVFKGSQNQQLSGSTGEVNFYNLELDNSAGLGVADGFGLKVVNSVALTTGDLRLEGEAQLLQVNDVANTGTGKLLRDQQGISSNKGYNYWSSPVNNGGTFTINDGLLNGTDPNSPVPFSFTAGFDGSAGTISERWLYTYPFGINGYNGWVKINKSSPIAPGFGFIMKGTGVKNQNYVFKGLPNNGTYTFTNVAIGQEVLLGNPYPSALDINKFIDDNFSVTEIYIWVDGGSNSHNLSDYKGGFATRNLTDGALALTASSLINGIGDFTGRNAPTNYLAVGQGFVVTAALTNNIFFNNSQRAFVKEGGSDSYFYKGETPKTKEKNIDDNDKSIIRIGYEDPKKFHRQLVLGFVPNSPANLNYNRGYDAIMMGPREDELFFIIDNDVTKKYVIQGVNVFDENNEFDLGLTIKEEGEHIIMLDAVENFSGKVFIKDVQANITYNLAEGKFKPQLPPGTYLDRFKLVFKDKSATVVAEDLVTAINPSPENTTVHYHENESLIVRTKNDLKVNNIAIYNILGQQIKQVVGNELGKNVFAIPFHYPIGVYMVIVESELGKETFKIINK